MRYTQQFSFFKNSSKQVFIHLFSLITFAFFLYQPVHAQTGNSNRTIRFIVPYSAGGLPDTVARIFAQRITEHTGQAVVVDNKPGANGVIAAQALSSSPKDGYTFLVTDGSMFSINPSIYRNINYDYKRDFLPVALAARAPLFLAVNPALGVNNLKELIALAKVKPGLLTYGSSGIGSTHHLCMEEFKSVLGLDITHIPFKGTGQSVPALIGNQVDMLFSALPSLTGFVANNQAKLIATNSLKRSPQAPELPAISEVIPGFDFSTIIGVLAASGTPQNMIDFMSNEVALASKNQILIQALNTGGIESVGLNAAEYGKAIQQENDRLGKVLKIVKIGDKN
jgi:tripartite-type tricarboxylate transporter receptor subunit TctC